MKRSINFFKLEEKYTGDLFWKRALFQPIGENRINVQNEEYDITPSIQRFFTNTNLTTKFSKNDEKEIDWFT